MILLTGMTCSGKTYFMKHGIIPNLDKYIIYDADLQYENLKDRRAKIVNNYNSFKKLIDVDYPWIVFQPSDENMRNYDARLLEFEQICGDINRKKYKTNFIIDDFCYIIKNKYNRFVPPKFSTTISRCKNVKVYAITQRPVFCTNDLLTQTDEYYIFNLLEKDQKYIEEFLPFKILLDDTLDDIQKHCLHFNVRTNILNIETVGWDDKPVLEVIPILKLR